MGNLKLNQNLKKKKKKTHNLSVVLPAVDLVLITSLYPGFACLYHQGFSIKFWHFNLWFNGCTLEGHNCQYKK